MKCIKNGDVVKRVSDKVALDKTSNGWEYTSKENWKQYRPKTISPKHIMNEISEELLEDTKPGKIHGLKAKDRKKSNKKRNK